MVNLFLIFLGVTMFFLHFFKIVGSGKASDAVAMYVWGLVAVLSGAVLFGRMAALS